MVTRAPSFAPFPPKLVRPSLGTDLVERPRLVDGLLAFDGGEVVISAPAGYGKTTLATQWAAREPRAFGWLSLDAADNDPVVLVTYLTLALHDLEPIAGTDLALLTRADVDLATLVDTLRQVVATRARPFVLALDDVHRIEGPSLDVVVTGLAPYVPAGSTLALLTRGASPVPTSRAALQGDALVIDTTMMAMTSAEAGELLHGAGVSPPAETIDAIRAQTEGWPAGLYLATLALRDIDAADLSVGAVTGRDRRIATFFAEEVLPALPPDDVEFLLHTAVLERLSGALCDAVLECTGSGARLERLARANRFVIPLDPTGDWYRYHHLFSEMLLAEARRRDGAGCDEHARRASDWFAQNGDPDSAITQALIGHDHDRAARVVWFAAPLMQNTRRLATVDLWLEAFDPDEVTRTPALAVPAALNALMLGNVRDVHRFAGAVEAMGDHARCPDGTPATASAALLRALTTSAGLETMRDDAARAFAGHGPETSYRGLASFLESAARTLLGDLAGARERADETVRLGRAFTPPLLPHGLAQRARIAMVHEDWTEATRLVDEAVDVVHRLEFADRPPMALVFSTAALVHLHDRRTERGKRERDHALALLPRVEDASPYQGAAACLELALASVWAGDLVSARAMLDDSERRLRRLQGAGLLPQALEQVRAELAEAFPAAGADLVEPLSPAEMRVLAWLPTHLSFVEIGEELFLSRNTVKSHAMAIYRKLGVTSRSAAVREATALGLLNGD
ncbi:MAG: LuxR C-terminal-related transcriptional regulator [Acidimicrobiia bacterium]